MTRVAWAASALGAWLGLTGIGHAQIAAPETTEVFTGTEDGRSEVVHALAHRFVLVGSESISRGGRNLDPEVGYRLDPDAGTLQLAEPLHAGEKLVISYAWVPLDLPREFTSLVRGEPTPVDSVRMAAEPSTVDRIARTVDEELVIGGAKTVAIEVGSNKDAAVEQSLRVSVTGRVGEDVKITALLSDQNVPLQPEGNTQRLEELDEVLIRVDARRGSATLGDFVAMRDGTAFANFERRLSGAEAKARAGPGQAWGIGASARGTFRTAEFFGVEGKQGPYVLGGFESGAGGVIVAGSERVWINGARLTRGENHDYVIDYSRGELEFTNRRLVTEDSEIAVDFEVAEQAYRRNFYLGEGAFASEGRGLEWRVGVASEVDDQDPLNLELSEENRELLAQAGDEPILVPGDVCTDTVGTGDYEKRTTAGPDSVEYFEYVGQDSGRCQVSFSFVGQDSGSYVRDRDLDTGLRFFRFVGAGAGDYEPGLLLTAPRRLTLSDMALRARTGGLVLEVDGAVSREDRNLLSTRSDDDNEAAAGLAKLSWERTGKIRESPLRFRTQASFRGEEASFVSLGRTRTPYLGEVWNFADSTRADEAEGGISAHLDSGDRWAVNGTYGVLERTGLFRSDRRAGNVSWSGYRLPEASYRIEKVRREDAADSLGLVVGDLLRQRAAVTGRVGWIRPALSVWKEDRDESRADSTLAGQNQLETTARLGLEPWSSWRTSLRAALMTTDDVEDGRWMRRSVGRTYEVVTEATPSRAVRARFSWIRRELDFEEDRGTDRDTQLTRGDLVHENLGGLLSGEYVYQTTSRFFSDILASPGAEEQPTLAINASARLRLGGRRSRAKDEETTWRRRLSLFRSETFVRVEEETTRPDRLPIYLLDLRRFQSDDDTIFGKILLRQEVTLFPSGGPFSLTGRWERIDTEDNRADPQRIEILSERTVLRARNRLGPRWTLESQGTLQDDSRSDSALNRSEFDVRLVEIREELVWQPVPTRRLSGRGGWVRERDRENDASIDGLSLGASASGTVFRRGRVRAELTWVHPLSIQGIDVANRFRTREVNQLDWRSGLDLSLSDHINAAISYSGRTLEGLPTTHLARAEVRALF
jgi:hypothetical protein